MMSDESIIQKLEKMGFKDVVPVAGEETRYCTRDGELMKEFRGRGRGGRRVAIFVCPACNHGARRRTVVRLLRPLPTEL